MSQRQLHLKRVWISLLLAAGLLIPGIRAVSAGQERPSPTVSYTVQTGDTLWSIAGDLAPDEDPRKIVHVILEVNDLSSPSVFPGQRIQLPAR